MVTCSTGHPSEKGHRDGDTGTPVAVWPLPDSNLHCGPVLCGWRSIPGGTRWSPQQQPFWLAMPPPVPAPGSPLVPGWRKSRSCAAALEWASPPALGSGCPSQGVPSSGWGTAPGKWDCGVGRALPEEAPGGGRRGGGRGDEGGQRLGPPRIDEAEGGQLPGGGSGPPGGRRGRRRSARCPAAAPTAPERPDPRRRPLPPSLPPASLGQPRPRRAPRR